MSAKTGKSRKSNHKKKAWKHIDLTDINQYLEDKELDERTGRTGEDVFFINKEGNSGNFKKNKLNDNLANDEIKQINDDSTNRQFRHLGSTSAVPAFKPNKRVNQTPLESVRQSKRLEKLSKSIEQSKKDVRLKKEKEIANKNNRYDLWEEKEKTPIGDFYVDYAEDFEKVRLARIFKCPRKQNPNVLKKPSLLPAVEQPHPGLSYNPNEDEHKDLLISIGERKKKELKEKRKLNKRLKEGFDPTINVHLENAKEMASGLFSENDDEDNEDDNEEGHEEIDDVGDNKSNNDNIQQPKDVIISDLKRRKSNKAKRNEIRERIDKINSKRRKEKKRLESEFIKLKHYVKEAKTAAKQTQSRIEKREQNKIDRMYRPARLGKRKYQDPEPEFCLEDELNGSLRKINTDGNLLMDRFKSLQRRNLIEHRRVQLKKRSKPLRKRVIRSSIANNPQLKEEEEKD